MSASLLLPGLNHLSPAVYGKSKGAAGCLPPLAKKVHVVDQPSNQGSAASETDLLNRVRSREQEAMTELYDRYSPVVYSVALRVLHDPGSAEDIVQDIFIQLWRNPDAFVSSRGSLCAWLAVVARNRSIDFLRRRKPEDSVEEVILASNTDFAAEAERDCMMTKVRGIMADLPPEQRRMLEMSFFEGRTHTEIADETGDPLGTVKTRIRSALLSLRKQLTAA